MFSIGEVRYVLGGSGWGGLGGNREVKLICIGRERVGWLRWKSQSEVKMFMICFVLFCKQPSTASKHFSHNICKVYTHNSQAPASFSFTSSSFSSRLRIKVCLFVSFLPLSVCKFVLLFFLLSIDVRSIFDKCSICFR